MKRSSVGTIALAALTALTTAAWAQHGAGAGGHGGGAAQHGAPAGAANEGSHGAGASAAGSGNAANFQTRLANNPNLSARLQALLPPNVPLGIAAAGFKNQGQFIAALHVANNLNIPFDQLKMDMLENQDSLGAAIRALRPDLSSQTVNTDLKIAQKQAKADVQESNQVAQNTER